ncbi:hypothetical protein cco94_00435 [Campylobacter coli H9]|nr:hypothetical protein cco16_01256 [Campylobacter coli 86119]EIA95235.1 hypothetical protein cco76_06933 [Campylobacter coli LMG 23336]EIB12404.1 hypothetical protein cco94_00435 [Campylobacter coli H9]ETC96362.1 hypothetical protein U469_03335 [Campylobacter coli K7]
MIIEIKKFFYESQRRIKYAKILNFKLSFLLF